jgi:hypothetical protein
MASVQRTGNPQGGSNAQISCFKYYVSFQFQVDLLYVYKVQLYSCTCKVTIKIRNNVKNGLLDSVMTVMATET